MVWYMEASPVLSGPTGSPRKAEKVPLCACRLETTGVGLVSLMIHGGKPPVSKPPLTRTQAPGVGVGVGVGVGLGDGVGVGVGVDVGVGLGVIPGLKVGVGVGVALHASEEGPWIPTVIGVPVLKKPIVAFAACGGPLASKRKLYKVPQRSALAFWFCTKVSEFQLRALVV
jgi:hypothetical protein